jgi:DNA-binding transcriptional MerR regulator
MPVNSYKTIELARVNGIHPNTVRLYEKFGFIPKPARQPNGYRLFTDLHMEQIKLIRMAFAVEVLQNGLRQKAIAIIKASAAEDFAEAIRIAEAYRCQIREEQQQAEEAVRLVGELLADHKPAEPDKDLTRQETAKLLNITMDALRNWEMNGLLTVKRKQNGYRIYSGEDLRRLKIIRALRSTNYSLSAILRMLSSLSGSASLTDLRMTINTPREDDEIISACDTLLTSLEAAANNADTMLAHLHRMRLSFSANPPL